MGSHFSFGHLKHKLWAKEGPGVKLPVWLSTTKSRESTWFTSWQRACHIPLEISQRKLQLCFRPHLNPRSAHKVMGFQSRKTSNLGVLGQKVHLDVGPVDKHRIYYKGEGGDFPQVRAVVRLVCPCCPWFFLALKVLQLCTNRLVWVLCRPVWVSEVCQLFLPELQHASLPLKVLWAKERAPIPPSSAVFYLDSHLNPSKSWECVSFPLVWFFLGKRGEWWWI